MARRPRSATDAMTPEVERLLQEAVALHRANRIREATERYKKILREPGVPNQALNLAGVAFASLGDSKSANRALSRALKHDAADVEALGNLARLNDQDGKHKRARELFRRAVKLRDTDSNLHYGLGCSEAALENMDEAEKSFRRALVLDPENLKAANNLGNALAAMDRYEDAKLAYEVALKIEPSHPETWFNLGNVERDLNRPDLAEVAFRTALQHSPSHRAAQSNLGSTLFDMARFSEAEDMFRQVLEIDASYAEGWNNLGNALERQGRYQDAIEALNRAIALKPDYMEAFSNLGIVHDRLDDPDSAQACYEQAQTISAESPQPLAHLANLFEKRNRLEETRDVLEKGLARFPQDPELTLIAAKLDRRQGDVQGAIEKLQSVRDAPLEPHLKTQIEMELGRSFDRAGDAERAYESFAAGNQLAEAAIQYGGVDKSFFRTKVENLTALAATAEVSQELEIGRAPSADTPVFLIGFPRSGTTLLDVILDGHPGIKTMEEKPAVAVMEAELSAGLMDPGSYGARLQSITAPEIERLRDLYFAEVDKAVTRSSDQILIDKFPLNIIQVPLILKIFPNARFILALRHPCDVILSCFMQAFEPNPAMANFFHLSDAAHLYDAVMGLWLRYQAALAPAVHTIRYEDLVADPASEARAVIQFLGLPWHEEVLNHVENSRRRGRINTPSYYQVSEPIYARAIGRWRRYEKFLGPDVERLAPYIEAFGYD